MQTSINLAFVYLMIWMLVYQAATHYIFPFICQLVYKEPYNKMSNILGLLLGFIYLAIALGNLEFFKIFLNDLNILLMVIFLIGFTIYSEVNSFIVDFKN